MQLRALNTLLSNFPHYIHVMEIGSPTFLRERLIEIKRHHGRLIIKAGAREDYPFMFTHLDPKDLDVWVRTIYDPITKNLSFNEYGALFTIKNLNIDCIK